MKAKVSLEQIIGNFSLDVRGPYAQHYIKALVDGRYGDTFDFDVFLQSIGKNLQRPLVWTLLQKQEFIKSMLKEQHIPPIYVIQRKFCVDSKRNNHYLIIDGKQRLSTMFAFARGEFHLDVNGECVYIDDLDDLAKRRILFYMPQFMIFFEYDDNALTDEQKIAWFEHINFAGTQQDVEHIKSLKHGK